MILLVVSPPALKVFVNHLSGPSHSNSITYKLKLKKKCLFTVINAVSLFRLKWKTKKEAQYLKWKKLHVWCWLVLFSFHVETAVHTRWEHAVKHGEHVDETAAADWSESRNPSSYVCCGQTCLVSQFASVDVIECSSFKKEKAITNKSRPAWFYLCFSLFCDSWLRKDTF